MDENWTFGTCSGLYYYYYYYLFTAIGFAPGGSGPYTTQLQQKTYNKNKTSTPYTDTHTHNTKTHTHFKNTHTLSNLNTLQ
jgi:hypothetical protein